MLSTATTGKPNLAPVLGLEQAMGERAGDESVLVDPKWFVTETEKYRREKERIWKEQILLWEMIYLFVEGKQVLKKAKHGGGWRAVPIPDRTDSPIYALNLVGFYSDNIKAKWTQSNTDIKWQPGRDTDDALGAVRAADIIHGHYARKLYTESFRQDEAALAQCGKYARYYYYTEDIEAYARREKYGTAQVGFGDGAFFCADCGASGPAGQQPVGAGMAPGAAGGLGLEAAAVGAGPEGALLADPAAPAHERGVAGTGPGAGQAVGGGGLDAYGLGAATEQTDIAGEPSGAGPGGFACPDCGSSNVEVESAPPVEVQTLEGYEEYRTGDICCEEVPAFELKHDISLSPQDSPYLIRTRRLRTSILESKFPFLKIRSGKSDDPGVRASEALKESSYTGRRTRAGGEDDDYADFIQVWLDPCLYSGLALKEAYRTLDGNEIPAGTRLADLFPTGMYVCRVEGVDGVVEVRDEHHRDFWVGGVYRKRALSSLGSGIEDMVEGQRQYNLMTSLEYTILRTCANPATLYEESLFPNGVSTYLGHPLKNLPVKTMGLPEGRRLQDVVHQLTPQPPTQAHFQYTQGLDIYLQKASRVTNVGLGQALGLDNTTATASEIADANAQGLFAPQLALKAEVDRRGAEIVVKLYKRHCPDERYLSLAGRRGKQDGVWLRAADIGTDLYAEVVPESYLPQTSRERQVRLKGLLQDVGGLPGLKLAMSEMPALLEQLTETYDVDLGAEDYTAAATVSRLRIEQMKAAVPMLGIAMAGMPPTQMAADPVTGEMAEVPVDPVAEAGAFLLGVLQPPIAPEELGHIAAIQFLRSWLTDDEGIEAPPELRAGVIAMVHAHLEGALMEAQLTGMVGLAGDPMGMAGPPEGGGGKGPKNQNPQPAKQKGAPKPQPAGV